MAADDLTTVENLKQYIGLSVKDDDALLGRLIEVASSWIRRYLDHDIYPVRTYQDQWVVARRSDQIWLTEWPVVAVSGVTPEGQTPLDTAVGASRGFWLELPNILHLRGVSLSQGSLVLVDYTAGFAERPPEIEQCCIDIAAYEYKRKARIAQNQKVLPTETVMFDTAWAAKFTGDVLGHWKRVVPRVGGLK